MESYQISLLKTEMKKKLFRYLPTYIIYNNIKSITNRCLSSPQREEEEGRIPLFVERENGWGLHFVKLVRYCKKRKIKSHHTQSIDFQEAPSDLLKA